RTPFRAFHDNCNAIGRLAAAVVRRNGRNGVRSGSNIAGRDAVRTGRVDAERSRAAEKLNLGDRAIRIRSSGLDRKRRGSGKGGIIERIGDRNRWEDIRPSHDVYGGVLLWMRALVKLTMIRIQARRHELKGKRPAIAKERALPNWRRIRTRRIVLKGAAVPPLDGVAVGDREVLGRKEEVPHRNQIGRG